MAVPLKEYGRGNYSSSLNITLNYLCRTPLQAKGMESSSRSWFTLLCYLSMEPSPPDCCHRMDLLQQKHLPPTASITQAGRVDPKWSILNKGLSDKVCATLLIGREQVTQAIARPKLCICAWVAENQLQLYEIGSVLVSSQRI